jgi:glycosyltransferase involved in cell wall biosynthesis
MALNNGFSTASPQISIVVPLYNEQDSVQPLYTRLCSTLEKTGRSFEIIFIDDFSKDKTLNLAVGIAQNDHRVKVVKLLNNFGQTGALVAGIDQALGEIIIPMDGDLQHAPEDIPGFLAGIDEGYDIVSGWRKQRVDHWMSRRFPSKIANKMLSWISGLPLHDFGTTFKAYRREVIKSVRLYGDYHRFIPILVKERLRKVRIKEIPIQNIVAPFRASNYGIDRTITVLFDLIRVKFLTQFRNRPLHLFGTVGGFFALSAFVVFAWLGFQRLVYDQTITGGLGLPVFVSAIFMLGLSVQLVLMGLFAEMLVKMQFDSRLAQPYVVEKIFSVNEKSRTWNDDRNHNDKTQKNL